MQHLTNTCITIGVRFCLGLVALRELELVIIKEHIPEPVKYSSRFSFYLIKILYFQVKIIKTKQIVLGFSLM